MASMVRPWYTDRGVSKQSQTWYASWRDEHGKTHRESLGTRDEEDAKIEFGKWLQRKRLEDHGLLPKKDAPAARPLAKHVADFIAAQEAKGVTAEHAARIDNRLTKILELAGWLQLADIEPNSLERALAALSAAKMAPSTVNAYLVHVRHLVQWLTDTGRIASNPIRLVKRRAVKGREAKKRRALSDDEARRLLVATANNGAWRHFTGEDRFWMYALAMGTGLRAEEVASLRKDRFDWALRTVRVPGPGTKNREEAFQPIPAELVQGLLAYVEARPGAVIWPKMDRTAEMLRFDLAAAKIPALDDEGRHVDFHALRHTFCTRLAHASVHPSIAQKLMRHADIKLTLSYYTHTDAAGRVSAVDSLHPILAPDGGRSGPQRSASGRKAAKPKNQGDRGKRKKT